MSDASAIDSASRRLSAALDALEAAAERRRQSDHGEDKLAAQVQALGTDRSKLAGDLDRRIGQLRAQFGEIGDMRLTMMAALTVGDELVEAGKRLRRLEEELASLQDARAVATERAQATQAAVAAALNSAAERIERVIKGLNRGLGENVAIG
jgi:cell division protein ZapA